MHIAIEGLDGAGKTQTAKALAKQIGFTFIEKPLHFLTDTDGMENYLRIMRHINENLPVDFTALYYGMGNLYLRYLAAGKISLRTGICALRGSGTPRRIISTFSIIWYGPAGFLT